MLARISETDVDSSAQLSAVLASVDFISGQTRSGSRRLARALKLRPKTPSPSLQAVLTFAELLRCTNRGSFHKTARLARKLLELAEVGPHSSQAAETMRAIALAHLGLAEVALDQLREAEGHLTEALEVSRLADVPYAELASLGGLAWLELIRGRLRRSERIARGAVELAQARGWERSAHAALSYSALALVELEWDDLDAAEGHARELGEIARRTDDVVGAYGMRRDPGGACSRGPKPGRRRRARARARRRVGSRRARVTSPGALGRRASRRGCWPRPPIAARRVGDRRHGRRRTPGVAGAAGDPRATRTGVR